MSVALVEKDYWVTHTLWAVRAGGLSVWFKGGTSLSKGFGLIERFSEDLDVMLEAPDLLPVTNWKSEGARATENREHFFEALSHRLRVPGAEVSELAALRDRGWRNAVFAIHYPSRFAAHLPVGVRPFIQLEVGSARVTPCEDRTITSWIHDHLFAQTSDVASGFFDNRPRLIHCVRPEVTVLEKIEAISRRYRREPFEPGSFVRHYEDVARILTQGRVAPDENLRSLLAEMRTAGDIRDWPTESDPAFNPDAERMRWAGLESAWRAISSIFWGERIPAQVCASRIRELLRLLP